MRFFSFSSTLGLLLLLTQCDGSIKPERKASSTAMTARDRENIQHADRLLDEPLFTNRKKKPESEGIGVNAYLWRASLDTFSFMPLQNVDPFSGVILTDWHTPKGTDGERLKANIVILDREVRPDSVRVSLFHQRFDEKKGWVDVPASRQDEEALEQTILTRARELKNQASLL